MITTITAAVVSQSHRKLLRLPKLAEKSARTFPRAPLEDFLEAARRTTHRSRARRALVFRTLCKKLLRRPEVPARPLLADELESRASPPEASLAQQEYWGERLLRRAASEPRLLPARRTPYKNGRQA